MRIFALVASSCISWATAVAAEEGAIYEEVFRLKSSNGKLEISIAKGNVDATVSTPYKVFVVSTGDSLNDVEPLFFADKLSQPDVIWIDDQTVSISCKSARVWQFRNFIYVPNESGNPMLRCCTNLGLSAVPLSPDGPILQPQ